MSNVVNIFTKQEVVVGHDEWAQIGVHLETRLAAGMSLGDAAHEVILAGIETERVNQYLKHEDLRHPERMALIGKLYTDAENKAIQGWLLDAPLDPQADCERMADAARVAEVVLFPVRTSLPQWSAVFSDGHVIKSREHQLRVIKERDEVLAPHFLFQINWADTAPGLSWPESYYLTLLPGYEVLVLTASQDSTDMFGHADIAISLIPPKADGLLPVKHILDAIAHWWLSELDGWSQGPWESLWGPGNFDPHELLTLRDKVWDGYLYG